MLFSAEINLNSFLLAQNFIYFSEFSSYQGVDFIKGENSFLVVFEGGDASGSGTTINALKNWAKSQGLDIFDLVEYTKQNHTLPLPYELKKYDVVISAEPTFCWVGSAIRDEVIRKDKGYPYSALVTAHAYSLDRELLFKRVLGPFLALPNKYVFQERSFISSVVYQPVHANLHNQKLSVETVLDLPGNRFVFENHCPDLVVILQCDPKERMSRLASRDKKDNAEYEKELFQIKVEEAYASDWLKNLLVSKSAQLSYINTSPPATVNDTEKAVLKIWLDYLNQFLKK